MIATKMLEIRDEKDLFEIWFKVKLKGLKYASRVITLAKFKYLVDTLNA